MHLAPEHALAAFPSEAAFYAADRTREFSREFDYGVWWTWPGPKQEMLHYRLSFVLDTGEIILVAAASQAVLVIARMPTLWQVETRERAIDVAMDGWAEHCGRGGLEWVMARLALAREMGLLVEVAEVRP